ncbi:MAG: hypothetical protein ACI4DP_02395 [Candidatus Ornithomonoglobus sp.]
MEKIELLFDTPYNPKVENFEDFYQSAFKTVYKKAIELVQEIIKRQKKEEKQSRSEEMIYNLLPFIGDRGTGKTSAMLSFKKFLDEYPNNFNKNSSSYPSEFYKYIQKFDLKDARFITLNEIDAGHFERDEDLLGVVLARMLAYYNHLLDTNNMLTRTSGHRAALYNDFSVIYKNLLNTKRAEKDPDLSGRSALKVLEDLDKSQNLKKSFVEVVGKFIEAVQEIELLESGNGSYKNTYVVISIDDLDMNLEGAHDMMQQIQSYMMIPNVIVLFTACYDNLVCICMNNYANFFKEVIHASSRAQTEMDKRFLDSCESLAHEYLNKFLPTGKIIHLRQKYTRIYVNLPALKLEQIFSEGAETDYSRVLSAIIFRATGIYMYLSEDKQCFLEPESIRAKAQYIHKIKQMSPVIKGEELRKSISTGSDEFRSLILFIQYTIDNLEFLDEDVSIRHIGNFTETQRRRLDAISKSTLRNISTDIYFTSIDIHKIKGSAMLMPWSYDSIYRDIYRFSNVIDILDSLEKINDIHSYKPFINTALSILTIRLILKKYNKLSEKTYMSAAECFCYETESAQIEYSLFTKYIGTSLFGWFDNQLVTPLSVNDINTKIIQDEKKNLCNYIGFSLNININAKVSDAGQGILTENGKIDTERIHTIAMFLLFLSKHEYTIKFDEENSELSSCEEVKIERDISRLTFIDNVDFIVSAYFVNICRPGIVIAFYMRVLSEAVKVNYHESEWDGLFKAMTKAADDLGFELPRWAESLKAFKQAMNEDFFSKIKEVENRIVGGIIPMLNIEFMYNIAREVRKKANRERAQSSAWKAYCEYFANIGEELKGIDEYYKNVNNYNDKRLENKYSKKIPFIIGENSSIKDKESFFSLNEKEIHYFNGLIDGIDWQNNTLKETQFRNEARNNYGKNNRDSGDDIQKGFR